MNNRQMKKEMAAKDTNYHMDLTCRKGNVGGASANTDRRMKSISGQKSMLNITLLIKY